jgi:nitroimidazol reductase NimA-like FMN-containing flavoprotein (pyridoxamine 5'-phosphate oxidase superfamily)
VERRGGQCGDGVIDVQALIRMQEESYAHAGRSLASSWPRESAMDSEQLRSFLEERRYCVLATTDAHGRAIARPVAFTVFGGSFWFATVAGARLGNIERTPWASVVIEDSDGDEHRAVAVDGPATITRHPPRELLEVWYERHASRADWAAAWFEVRPRRLVSYVAR